jgi:hypothetical protein
VYDVVGASAVEHVVVEAFVFELHPLSNAVTVMASKFNSKNCMSDRGGPHLLQFCSAPLM